jgi:hypothetical protein
VNNLEVPQPTVSHSAACTFCSGRPAYVAYRYRDYERIGSRGKREPEGWYAVCSRCDQILSLGEAESLRAVVASVTLSRVFANHHSDEAQRRIRRIGRQLDRTLRGFLSSWTGERMELVKAQHQWPWFPIPVQYPLTGTTPKVFVDADGTYFCPGCKRRVRLDETLGRPRPDGRPRPK